MTGPDARGGRDLWPPRALTFRARGVSAPDLGRLVVVVGHPGCRAVSRMNAPFDRAAALRRLGYGPAWDAAGAIDDRLLAEQAGRADEPSAEHWRWAMFRHFLRNRLARTRVRDLSPILAVIRKKPRRRAASCTRSHMRSQPSCR